MCGAFPVPSAGLEEVLSSCPVARPLGDGARLGTESGGIQSQQASVASVIVGAAACWAVQRPGPLRECPSAHGFLSMSSSQPFSTHGMWGFWGSRWPSSSPGRCGRAGQPIGRPTEQEWHLVEPLPTVPGCPLYLALCQLLLLLESSGLGSQASSGGGLGERVPKRAVELGRAQVQGPRSRLQGARHTPPTGLGLRGK